MTVNSANPRTGSEVFAQAGPIFASMLGLSCGIATIGLPYSIGIMSGQLRAEFGWTHAQLGGIQPVVAVAVVIAAWLVGTLIDRIGARRVILGSMPVYALGFVALGNLTNSLLSFQLIYFLLALAGGGTLAVTFTKLLAGRFDRERGLALGLALCGSGVSSFVYAPLLAGIVERYGWRVGYYSIAAAVFLLAMPAAWVWLHDVPTTAARGERLPGMAIYGRTLRYALVSWPFWALFLAVFLFSGAVTGMLNNFQPILQERGYDLQSAARIAGTFGIAIVVGRISIGAMIDRMFAPVVGGCVFALSAVAVFVLAQQGHATLLTIILIAAAGLAAGAEVDLMAYLVSRYYGLRDFGKIYAGIYIGFAAGPGLLVPLFGYARDRYGSFSPGLIGVAACMLTGAILLFTLKPYPVDTDNEN